MLLIHFFKFNKLLINNLIIKNVGMKIWKNFTFDNFKDKILNKTSNLYQGLFKVIKI